MSGREISFRSSSVYKLPIYFAVRIQGSVLISKPTFNQAFSKVPVVCSENERKWKKTTLFRQQNTISFTCSSICEKKPEKNLLSNLEVKNSTSDQNIRKLHLMQWSFQKIYQQQKVRNCKGAAPVTWNVTEKHGLYICPCTYIHICNNMSKLLRKLNDQCIKLKRRNFILKQWKKRSEIPINVPPKSLCATVWCVLGQISGLKRQNFRKFITWQEAY